MFFTLSKIFWVLIQPLNALCLLAISGLGLRFAWKSAGQRVMNAALILILILGIFPIGPALMVWLETRYRAPETLPARIDGMIVLGGAFESYLTKASGHIAANGQISRVLCFVELARAHPESRLVFSGGSGDIMNPDAMETEDAKAFFNLTAINTRKIIYEDKSRNTYENARFTREIVKPRKDEHWVLITSAYHMPRSMGVFAAADWPVIPYPCDRKTDGSYGLFSRLPGITGNFGMLNISLKEILGSIVYYLTGKSAFILPPAPVASTDEASS